MLNYCGSLILCAHTFEGGKTLVKEGRFPPLPYVYICRKKNLVATCVHVEFNLPCCTCTFMLQLLNDGLNDHSELVQEACVNGLLRSWSLESMDGDFITLLSRLDVESSQQVLAVATHVNFAYGIV